MKIKIPTFLLTIFLTGCAENPLLGEWRQLNDESAHCKVVKFTSDREYCGSVSHEVSYEVSDFSVMVKPYQKSALLAFDISYTVLSKDVISFTSPFRKKEMILVRSGTVGITKDVIKYYKKFTLSELEESCDSGPATVTHSSEHWSKVVPKKIHDDICKAAELKKKP